MNGIKIVFIDQTECSTYEKKTSTEGETREKFGKKIQRAKKKERIVGRARE